MNLKTPTPKRQRRLHPPLHNWSNFSENVVQGKIAKVTHFQEQGLEIFLDKLRAQGWLELFANTQLGCSVPDLAEFYANYNITNVVVTSEVNEKKN